jgi:thiol-disulfide isomerase/thioredoxin
MMGKLKLLMAIVTLQALLVAAYFAIEATRSEPEKFRWERLDEPAPALSLEHAGRAIEVSDGVHLVHFWATWCAPCREELPALIAAARTEGVALLAVTDEPWPLVVRHFDGEVPPGVVRDITGGAATDWRVPALPDTYAVVHGRIVARVGGARDWNTHGARRFLADLRGER